MSELLLKTIENDFRNAIARLQDGKPNNRELRKRKSAGTLKINFSTVALEARRARGLIGLKDDCRLPEIRDLVLDIMEGRTSEARTHTELVEKLRVEKAELKAQVRLYQTEALAQFQLRKKADKRFADSERKLSNALKQLAQARQVVSLAAKRPPDDPSPQS